MRRIQRAARFLLHADAATKPWAHTPRAQKWVQTHWPPEQRAPCDGTSELRACNARPSNQETPSHTHPNRRRRFWLRRRSLEVLCNAARRLSSVPAPATNLSAERCSARSPGPAASPPPSASWKLEAARPSARLMRRLQRSCGARGAPGGARNTRRGCSLALGPGSKGGQVGLEALRPEDPLQHFQVLPEVARAPGILNAHGKGPAALLGTLPQQRLLGLAGDLAVC